MAKNNYEQIDFQQYVDGVKQQEISWKFFTALMKDLAHRDIKNLRILNAILLTELTIDYSDIDRFKYLNGILMIQFKNYIQREHSHLETQIDDSEKNLNTDQILNEETCEKTDKVILTNEDVQMPIVNENIDSTLCNEEKTECNLVETNPQYADFEMKENDHFEVSQVYNVLNEETTSEISTNEVPQRSIANEHSNYISSYQEHIIESNTSETNPKIFLCKICNKEYKIYFHLKKHIQKAHEKTNAHNYDDCQKSFSKLEDLNTPVISIHNDNEYKNTSKLLSKPNNLKTHSNAMKKNHKDNKCKTCTKSFSQASDLKRHIHTVHDGYKDYKCETCGKSYSSKQMLKKHIHTVHEGYRDYKCKACSKTFSTAGSLKIHIRRIH